jgi:hypothetical protein
MKERIQKKDPFHLVGFLYSYFFYLLKKNVDVFLINQLGRKTFQLVDDNSCGEDDDEIKSGFAPHPVEYTLEQWLCTMNIDETWVLGEKVFVPFDQLTIQERQLLKWRYVDNKKSSEISKKINEHPNTIREHLSKIKDKLAEFIMDEKNGLDDLKKELGLQNHKKNKKEKK